MMCVACRSSCIENAIRPINANEVEAPSEGKVKAPMEEEFGVWEIRENS